MQFYNLVAAFVMLFSTSLAQSVITETQKFTSAVTETLTSAVPTNTVVIGRVSTLKKVIELSKTIITQDYTTTFCPSPTTFVHKDTTYSTVTATRIVITTSPEQGNPPSNPPSTMQTSVSAPSKSKTVSINPAATQTGVVITGAANQVSVGLGVLIAAGVAALVL